MKILVVCSGNICRSPMVAEYLKHRLGREGLSHVVVSSAGTLGINGAPAAAEAIEAMAEVDVDLQGHRSRGISAADIQSSDMVIVMDHRHLEELAVRYPTGRDFRYLLRQFEKGPEPASSGRDLQDPIGSELAVFRKQREVLRVCVDHLVLHLKHTLPS
ncbi:MAG: hypothetical protein GTN89_05885 [Acidobacteria bacterium]|nr:hypothetical protein [Acidobacteriota bacterium]NIM62896.1 hypothetical protein [Acidobacteriota bacterium]NIO58839.1 hypothetical protein [Acidobacteriota bacterium]NIQ29896.1 hypothetical protein [Acidobacteriota bacterium]NIQ84620.1 hypothetical protein [Acidobacteriota bacterium]